MRVIDYSAEKLMPLAASLGVVGPRTAAAVVGLNVFSCIDRTGKLDLGVKFLTFDPIPTGRTTKSLEEICDDTARALIAENRPMAFYWSGGIDSTLALISLLKAGVPRDLLTVVMTHFSVKEYPEFYARFIKDKLQERRVGMSVFPYVRTDELIVTGEHGDQIMGSDKIYLYYKAGRFEALFTDPWESAARMCLGDDQLVEYFRPLMEAAPFPMTCAYDFFWWINFTTKWQHVLLRMTNGLDDIAEYLQVVRHFFRGDDFQRWAMDEQNHRTLKCGNAYHTYKTEMKRIIRECTNDETYFANKIKIGSLPSGIGQPFLLLLEDGRRVMFGEYSDRLDVFERVYGRGRFKDAYGVEFADLFTGVKI